MKCSRPRVNARGQRTDEFKEQYAKRAGIEGTLSQGVRAFDLRRLRYIGEACSGNRWTVPVGGGGGKLFRLGKLLVNTQLQAFYNVERPDFAADWQLRFQLQFLFPK